MCLRDIPPIIFDLLICELGWKVPSLLHFFWKGRVNKLGKKFTFYIIRRFQNKLQQPKLFTLCGPLGKRLENNL